jgi:hypothetical protein
MVDGFSNLDDYNSWLVVWNMALMFPYIGNVIMPTDYFSEGQRGRYTTNQIWSFYRDMIKL